MAGPPSSQLRALNRALAAYKAGKLGDAEDICARIVTAGPGFFEALHVLGAVQASQGKHEKALASYDRALALRHDDAAVLNNRGVTLQALRRFDEALASFDRVLSRQPNDAGALYNRGNVLQELRRHEDAVASYDRALALRPDNVAAHYNRAKALHALRRFDEALAGYDRALAVRPDHAKALNDRGIVLRELRRLDEALASFDRALAVRPDHAEALNNRGAVLKELGRLEEARGDIEKAIRLSPRTPGFYLNLATAGDFAAADSHLAALREMAGTADSLMVKQRTALHFALGQMLPRIGQHELSFRHLLEGNALERRQVAYDEAATLGLCRRIETVFTPAVMRGRPGPGNPSDVPVFIVGMPRSGSTLVEQILASHPRVFGAGELDRFADSVTSVLSPLPFPEGVASLAGDKILELGTHYLNAVATLAPEAARITDKNLLNFGFIGLIRLALPNARIVHTHRDPIDTCLSCFSTLFAAGHAFTYDLGELGRFYRAYQSLMDHWRQVLPDGSMLEVRYEDVVDDLPGQARRLVAHCGLAWDDACLAFHETRRPVGTASAAQVRQPIYRGSVGRWRPSDDQLRPLLEGLGFR